MVPVESEPPLLRVPLLTLRLHLQQSGLPEAGQGGRGALNSDAWLEDTKSQPGEQKGLNMLVTMMKLPDSVNLKPGVVRLRKLYGKEAG